MDGQRHSIIRSFFVFFGGGGGGGYYFQNRRIKNLAYNPTKCNRHPKSYSIEVDGRILVKWFI